MPPIILNLLISLAIKFGIPAIVKYLPGVPQAVLDVITELLEKLKQPDVSNSAAKKTAMNEIKRTFSVGNPGDLKGNY